MSWSRRALLGMPLLPLLAGCGFHPMYGEEEAEAVDPELASVTVLPIADRLGQQLRFMLREQLNPDTLDVTPRYLLQVSLNAQRIDLGLQRDATSVRGRIDLSASMHLSRADNHKEIFQWSAISSADFTILSDAYAAQVAEDDARVRTIRDVSRQIRLRLSAFLERQKRRAG